MIVRRFAALAAAALVAGAFAEPEHEALAADDECAVGAGCALEALQLRGEAKVHEGAQKAPALSHEALLQAMAADGLPKEHLDAVRLELAEVAKLSAEELEARSNASCSTWTGGTCMTSDCAASRGGVKCSSFRCVCRRGFCEHNGVCAFSYHRAQSSYGGTGGSSWGAPTASSWGSPTASSWGAPTASSWGSPIASSWGAPTASAGWGAPSTGAWGSPGGNAWGSQGASSWGSSAAGGWGAPSASSWGGAAQGGGAASRDTGGTCMLSSCDLSRGDTRCNIKTGYKCLCRVGSRAVNGVCMR